MVKSELIEKLAARCSLTVTDTERILNTFFRLIYQTTSKGEKMKISGFGTFSVRERKGRQWLNPNTHKLTKVPKLNVPRFHPGEVFRREVRKK
jgi:nucleoid DNA-binding protein